MALLDKPVQLALDKIKDSILNPRIKEYGTIQEISFKNKKLNLTITLLGLEDTPFTASASKIIIAEDGSTIKFDSFEANKPFLLNALNNFGTAEIQIPDISLVRTGLVLLRKIV